jgi:hypothetical protein
MLIIIIYYFNIKVMLSINIKFISIKFVKMSVIPAFFTYSHLIKQTDIADIAEIAYQLSHSMNKYKFNC